MGVVVVVVVAIEIEIANEPFKADCIGVIVVAIKSVEFGQTTRRKKNSLCTIPKFIIIGHFCCKYVVEFLVGATMPLNSQVCIPLFWTA